MNKYLCKYISFFLFTKKNFIFAQNKFIMKKETRGRKPIPDGEKKKVLRIFVKQKHFLKAKSEALLIEKKYTA